MLSAMATFEDLSSMFLQLRIMQFLENYEIDFQVFLEDCKWLANEHTYVTDLVPASGPNDCKSWSLSISWQKKNLSYVFAVLLSVKNKFLLIFGQRDHSETGYRDHSVANMTIPKPSTVPSQIA